MRERLKEEGKALRKEVREKTIGYLLAAFGLVAGLAWNDAIKTAIEEFFPLKGDTILAKIIYAVLITLLVVIITMYLARLSKKNSE